MQYRQLDLTVPKSKSKWEFNCPICKNNHITSYTGIRSKIKRNSMDCISCAAGKRYENPNFREKIKKLLEIRNSTDNPVNDPAVREKMRLAKLGKRGVSTGNWRGGSTKEKTLLMSQDPYKKLRLSVFKRDNFKCQLCGDKNKLEMDHIKEWVNYPDLRFSEDNCRTLCHSCHAGTPNYGHKAIRKKNYGSEI